MYRHPISTYASTFAGRVRNNLIRFCFFKCHRRNNRNRPVIVTPANQFEAFGGKSGFPLRNWPRAGGRPRVAAKRRIFFGPRECPQTLYGSNWTCPVSNLGGLNFETNVFRGSHCATVRNLGAFCPAIDATVSAMEGEFSRFFLICSALFGTFPYMYWKSVTVQVPRNIRCRISRQNVLRPPKILVPL